MSLLVAENISKSYPLKKHPLGVSRSVDAIKNISFTLEPGKTLAIVGETGSGKSTLARQIIGIEKPTQGNVIFDGQTMNYSNKKHRKRRFKNIRMIFQNPYESLNPQARIGTTLEEVLNINSKLSAKQRRKKVSETLIKVGLLPEHQYRYPHMFSGGQRQRIAIARAIILEPQVIIADEPLSALDVSIQAQILNLLQQLQEEMGISFLFISHDLNVVEHIADQVMVMFQGEMVEYGNIEQIFDHPQHPYTQTLFASTPMYRKRFPQFIKPTFGKRREISVNGCCFASRCPCYQPNCEKSRPALLTQDNGQRIACFRFQDGGF